MHTCIVELLNTMSYVIVAKLDRSSVDPDIFGYFASNVQMWICDSGHRHNCNIEHHKLWTYTT